MQTVQDTTEVVEPEWMQHIRSLEPVVVHTNWSGKNDLWVDGIGEVRGAQSKSHRTRDRSRDCVHSLRPPAPCEFFGADWARQLVWMPVLYKLGPNPVIASRTNNLVTISFDRIGATRNCDHHPGKLRNAYRFVYTLRPFIFDDKPDEVVPHFWLGTWVD
jgi:hypothetical protein